MRLKYFLITLVAVLFSMIFFGALQGQASIPLEQEISINSEASLFAQTSSPNPLLFAYTSDGEPVSSSGNTGVEGYCLQLKDYLKEQSYSFEEDIGLEYSERFKLDKDNKKVSEPQRWKDIERISIECGPNTISQKRMNELAPFGGKFSDPFFTTGAKLLIRNDRRELLNSSAPVLKVGVIGNTTTAETVNNIYPTAEVFPLINREGALNNLKSGLDAYISDEALLIPILELLPRGSYSIEPKVYGLTRESYGVVVYNNPILLGQVNKWIENEGKRARNQLRWRVINANRISALLSALVARSFFYPLTIFLVFFSLLLVLTHPVFIYSILKLIPVRWGNKVLQQLKIRASRTSNGDPLVKLGNYVFKNELITVIAHSANSELKLGFISKDTAFKLVEEVGIQTLLQNYERSGLPSDVAERKVEEDIANRVRDDEQLSSMLRKWLDVAGSTFATETPKKIVEGALRMVESALGQSGK